MAEETVDLIIHTIHHQTINPPVIGEVAASLIRGIAELECEVSESCSYNNRISYSLQKRWQADGQFEMWMAATVHTSAVIDISEMIVTVIDVDSANKRIEIVLPEPYFDYPRVVSMNTSITEASHLSSREATAFVSATFEQHIHNAGRAAIQNAESGTILHEVQIGFTEQVQDMLTNVYPGVEVTVVFENRDSDQHIVMN